MSITRTTKQSSIEWLFDWIEANMHEDNFNILSAKEKAVQMHKEEIELSDEEIDNAVVKEYENVGDEKLFPNFTDKDIWQNGFYEGAKWYREQLKNTTNRYNTNK